jgi:non-specific serine/threonine protein kinase
MSPQAGDRIGPYEIAGFLGAGGMGEVYRANDPRLRRVVALKVARLKLLSPSPIRGRLQGRLQLLTGGARDLPARQQTLRAAIDWSHELLEPFEQTLFRRLSVFVGGADLQAVENGVWP